MAHIPVTRGFLFWMETEVLIGIIRNVFEFLPQKSFRRLNTDIHN